MNRHQRRAAAASGDTVRHQLEAATQQIQLGRFSQAERLLKSVLAADRRNPDALHLTGLVAYHGGNFERAVEFVTRALAVAERSPLYWNTLGSAQRGLGQMERARDSFRRATVLAPDYAAAHNNLGLMLHELGPLSEAEQAFRRALARRPDYAAAAANLGTLLFDMGRFADAADILRRALALDPGDRKCELFYGRALKRLQRFDEATTVFRRVLMATPGDGEAQELLQESQFLACDWSEFDRFSKSYREKIAAGIKDYHYDSLIPAGVPGLSRADHLVLNRTAAVRHSMSVGPAPARVPHSSRPKLRIGYISGDFCEHPVANLTAELFELHDRTRFEVVAYSNGPDDGSAIRARIVRAFDRFTDIRDMPVRAAADRIAADEVDVLVDLAGYTQFGCPKVLALRPAPIQVNFLGFPGTLGADWMDYILVDRLICPPEHAADYTEAFAYLPDCYMPSDRQRRIAEPAPSRAECGLPDDAFVFCCFNNSWKITPRVFDVWMRLLESVPRSVLWLRDFNADATRNLRAAAAARGVGADRVVFAGRADYASHLARLGCADLFLDTLPYNAHATASDSLWAGLPVLTCIGEAFASRVCASLLTAAGLPELITADLGAYEQRARELALGGTEIRALRARLAANRETCALFDSVRFTRNLEAVVERMWQRHADGLPPATIDLAAAPA